MHPLLQATRKSYDLLDLEDDWDDEGAAKPKEAAFNEMLVFMHWAIENVGLDLSVPDISCGRDGSIFVSFIEGDYSFLIIFDEGHVGYFGYNSKTNSDQIKHTEMAFGEVIEWLKKFMTHGNDGRGEKCLGEDKGRILPTERVETEVDGDDSHDHNE